MIGNADGPPTKIGISAADNLGAAAGAMAIAAALLHKRRTGRGQHINISMHDIQGWLTSQIWALLDTKAGARRNGNRHFALAPQNLFQARDGLVAIEIETQKQLDALCGMIGYARIALAAGKAHEAALEARLKDWVAERTTDAAIGDCLAAKVPAGRVQGIDDIADNPFTWERKMLVALKHPECGVVKVLGSPFKSTRSPGIVATAAPTIGQHSREILGQLLGYSKQRIDELAAEKIIAVAAASPPA